MKRVLVDQGSAVEVMYPDLYKGLKLRPEDLTAYDSPLVSFEGKTITSKSQIRLPIQTGSDIVEVDFIVVDAYSPYTAIVARPWLHALGAVSSTLHQKVKYPDLYKGLKLRPEDLTAYDSPLVSFEGKIVTPKGQIRLPIQTGSDIVEVDFIVVDTFRLIPPL